MVELFMATDEGKLVKMVLKPGWGLDLVSHDEEARTEELSNKDRGVIGVRNIAGYVREGELSTDGRRKIKLSGYQQGPGIITTVPLRGIENYEIIGRGGRWRKESSFDMGKCEFDVGDPIEIILKKGWGLDRKWLSNKEGSEKVGRVAGYVRKISGGTVNTLKLTKYDYNFLIGTLPDFGVPFEAVSSYRLIG